MVKKREVLKPEIMVVRNGICCHGSENWEIKIKQKNTLHTYRCIK